MQLIRLLYLSVACVSVIGAPVPESSVQSRADGSDDTIPLFEIGKNLVYDASIPAGKTRSEESADEGSDETIPLFEIGKNLVYDGSI